MSTIKKLEIYDFQSHHRTELEPAQAGQLTVIVGPSDSGKTAIIRALRWLYYDVPRGVDFINVKANAARVTVTYTGDIQVTRERSRTSFNRYLVGDQRYEGFNNTVPAEVQEVTGVRPVVIGDMELNLNLAEQLDGPFLGRGVSAPAKAKVLGKLAGTEEVDYAAKQLNTDLYRRRQEEKNLDSELSKLEEQVKKFDYLPTMAERIKDLEQVIASIKAINERRQKLTEAQGKLQKITQNITDTETIINRWQYVELAEYSLAGAEKTQVIAGNMRHLKTKLQTVDLGIEESTVIILRWNGLDIAEDKLSKATDRYRRHQRLLRYQNSLESILSTIDLVNGTIARWVSIESAQEIFDRAVRTTESRNNVFRLNNLLKQITAAIDESKRISQCWAQVDETQVLLEKTTIFRAQREKIVTLGGLLRQVKSAINVNQQVCSRWKKIGEAEALIRETEAHDTRRNKIIDIAVRYRQANSEARRAQESTVLLKQRVSELEGAYKDELVSVGRCPLCGNDIDIQKLKEVI